MVFYTHDTIPDRVMEMLTARNPSADPNDLVANGWSALRELCERYVAVGLLQARARPVHRAPRTGRRVGARRRVDPPIQN